MRASVMLIKSPPVRVLVAFIVLLPVTAVSVALAALLFSASRSISESLGSNVVETETARVTDEIQSYLSEAVRVSDLYARRLSMGTLPLTGLTKWEPLMADDLFTSKRVASICFGNRQGEATYLQMAHGRRELGRVSSPLVDQAEEYQVDSFGRITGSPLRVYQYDARQRPWYTLALRSSGPRWTPPYFWFGTAGGDTETGCGYTRVINDSSGRYAGVLTIDLTLGALSDYLHDLPFANTGYIYVVDEQGLLVAASHGAVNSLAGERLRLDQSVESSAKVVAEALAAKKALVPNEAMKVTIDGKAARAQVTADTPYPGINWRIVTVMPESAFLTEARSAQRRAITMAVIAAIGALALSLLLGRRITVPLRRLTDHVARIGDGEFDSRLELKAARELSQLASATNKMAGGLKERMELEQSLTLATEVQQSLLPQGVDPPAGLDVAGVSRYCDQTGGDYFDFVDIAGLPRERMLIAVGDVMGHGIAAALLMATARASLRTGAMRNDSLGTILANVNHILAKDARHNRFMTMVLLTVDPAAHTVNWASAGHDPVIAYDPQKGDFVELADGDLLLGAMDGQTYGDYSYNELRRGTILFVGTDGIWEADNPSGEMYGKNRLHAFIRSHAHKPAAEMVRDLERELNAFRNGQPARDDVTYVIVKMVGTPVTREVH